MADSYSKWVMTTAFANNLQASINSGNKIEWVSIKTSNDTHLFADLAGFNDTTLATASIKQTATINTISINGNTVTITALFNNQDNQADYYIKTLFLVAKYNGTEFLAGATVANSASTAFRMPAASATEITEFTARPQITVSNSSTISATVDPVAAATNKRVDGLEATLQGEIDDINADKQSLWNTLVNYVTKSGTDTITGVKTFTQTIVGSITGNAGTATKLQTPRKLKVNLASTADQTFDGSADQVGIGVSGVLPVNYGGTGRTDGVNVRGSQVLGITDFNAIQLPISTSPSVRGFPFSAYGASNTPNASENGFRGWLTAYDQNGTNTIELIAVGTSGTLYVGKGATTTTNQLVTTTSITWRKLSDDSTVVHNTGDETISGNKTFNTGVYTNGGLFSKGVEISNTTPYVDFHYANYTGDYTSRIIENSNGQLTFLTTAGAKMKIAADLQGTADVATKLATTRSVQTNLESTSATNFDGTANITPGVTGVLPPNNGGTGNAFNSSQMVETLTGITSALSFTLPTGLDVKARTWVFTVVGSSTNGFPDNQVYTGFLLGGTGSNRFRWFTMADGNHIWYTAVGNYTRTGDTYTIDSLVWTKYADDSTVVHNTGTETIAGNKTFSSPIKGAIYNRDLTADTDTKTLVESLLTEFGNNTPFSISYTTYDSKLTDSPIDTQYLLVEIHSRANARVYVRVTDTANRSAVTSYSNGTVNPWERVTTDSYAVHNTGNEAVAGIKTFSSSIVGSVTGNAGTATKLATARTIAVTGDVTGSGTFDGSGNLTITATESATTRTNTTSTQAGTDGATVTMIDGVTTNGAGEVTGVNTKTLTLPPTQTTVTGNAGSATKLANARTIGGVSFDGTANINLPGVNIAGNQSTTGNAGSATKLQTARTINGVAFDGTANISVNAANDTSLVHNTGNENVAGVKTFSDWPVVTGLNVSNGTYNAGIVHTNMSIPNQSNSNVSLGINAGSTLAIGGGEAANSFLSAMADGAVPIGSTDGISEQLVLASDVAVYVGAGYQSGGTTGKWWAFNQNGTVTSPNGNLMQEVTSTTINLYGKGTYFVNDTAPDGDYLRLIVSGKVVSVQGTLMTKVAMSGSAYLGEAIVPAQYAPPVARKNTVGFNAGSPGSKVYADVAWSIDGMLSIDNIVNGSNMTAWGTIPAGSQLSFSDTWVIA